MAKLVLDCVTVSEIGVGGHSYGQDPVVGVQEGVLASARLEMEVG